MLYEPLVYRVPFNLGHEWSSLALLRLDVKEKVRNISNSWLLAVASDRSERPDLSSLNRFGRPAWKWCFLSPLQTKLVALRSWCASVSRGHRSGQQRGALLAPNQWFQFSYGSVHSRKWLHRLQMSWPHCDFCKYLETVALDVLVS